MLTDGLSDRSTSTSTQIPPSLKEKTPNASISNDDEAKPVEPQDATEYPKGTSLTFIVVALMLSIFLCSLDTTIIATAIPKITDEFHGLDKVSWYGSAFFMTLGGFQSSWGKAYKYFPLKIVFLLAIFIFEVGSLICGVAPNSTALIVGRAIAGLGAAGIGTGAYTIIAFVAPPAKRPMFTGFIGVSYGIASVLGPILGGVFSDKVSWRWCFYINLPIGGVSALIILFFFHAPSGAKPVAASAKEKLLQMDLVGTAMMMGAIVAYLLALQYGGQTKAWRSREVVGLLVGFVAILAAFGVWEHFQGERAMIGPRLFKQRMVVVSCVYAFFFAGTYFIAMYYLPIYFQSVGNVSPTQSGVDTLPLIISVSVAFIASGMFIAGTGHAVPTMVAGAVIATVASGLLYTLDIGTDTGKWIGYQILGGAGWGMAFQVPIIVAQSNATAEDMSSVTAIVLFFTNLGGSFFVSAAQCAFVNTLLATLPATAPGVDPTGVVATGATQLHSVYPAAQVPGILRAYMAGIKVALAIGIAGAGIALVAALCGSWRRLNREALKSAGGAA